MEAADKGCILLVDDEAAVLRALKRMLKPSGYKVLTAESGHEGLALMEQESVNLVISDMRMPQMTGAEFLSQVALKWPQTDRILLTGYADLESTIKAVNDGRISRYLNKPWDDDEVIDVVQRSLRAVQLEHENRRLQALTEQQNAQLKTLNQGLEEQVQARTAQLVAAQKKLKGAYDNLTDGYRATIRVFATLVQRRMHESHEEAQQLGRLILRLGQQLALEPAELKQLNYAWMLRNVGKASFDDSLIHTPYALLEPDDQRLFHKHPLLAHASILTIRPLDLAATLIRQHKEYLDGSGYPEQRQGVDIDPRAQILCVANDYRELVAGLLLKRPLGSEEALAYLKEHAGVRYRADAVAALEALLPQMAREGDMQHDGRITTAEMTMGMVLTRDLVSEQGILLLTRGFRLDDTAMIRVRELEANLGETFELYVQRR
ncbi:MAG: response regulator [Marinobacterium sp.]|nr:response regulator [Marinobacterium sp.]